MSDILIAIGQEIKAARKKKGWQQTDLAEASKVAQKTISNIETAKVEVCIITLEKLAKALDYRLPTKLLVKKK